MPPEVIAALIQVGAMLTQQGINIFSSNQAQQKNEEYYNQYGSPVAIRKQMRDAGMSDAAIGQKITGVGGGTVLQSVQAQPADYQNAIGNLVEKMQGVEKNEKELDEMDLDIIQKRLQNESQRINNRSARYNLAKLPWELKKLKYEAGISEEAYQVARYTFDDMVNMTGKQLKQMDAALTKAYVEIIGALYDNDVKKYDATIANFKYELSHNLGVPIEKLEQLGSFNGVTEFITLLLELGLGHKLEEKDVFKNYEIKEDENGKHFVNVRGMVRPELDKDIEPIETN